MKNKITYWHIFGQTIFVAAICITLLKTGMVVGDYFATLNRAIANLQTRATNLSLDGYEYNMRITRAERFIVELQGKAALAAPKICHIKVVK